MFLCLGCVGESAMCSSSQVFSQAVYSEETSPSEILSTKSSFVVYNMVLMFLLTFTILDFFMVRMYYIVSQFQGIVYYPSLKLL